MCVVAMSCYLHRFVLLIVIKFYLLYAVFYIDVVAIVIYLKLQYLSLFKSWSWLFIHFDVTV